MDLEDAVQMGSDELKHKKGVFVNDTDANLNCTRLLILQDEVFCCMY